MISSKLDRALRNHQKFHKRFVIFIGHGGLMATASVCMPLAWGQMVGDQQQPAKGLAITPKLAAAKLFAEDGVGAPAAPSSNRKNHLKSFGGTSTALLISNKAPQALTSAPIGSTVVHKYYSESQGNAPEQNPVSGGVVPDPVHGAIRHRVTVRGSA